MNASAKFWLHSTLRAIAALAAIVVLLSPGLVMALVYTDLNLLVAIAAVLLVIAFRRHAKLRWWLAVLGALLIAVPPYPYWLFSNNQGVWYFSFFGGFTLQSVPFGTFAAFFVAALALFAVLFWAFSRPRQVPNA
jgi:hypothetical protein